MGTFRTQMRKNWGYSEKNLWRRGVGNFKKNRYLYLMVMPGILYFVVFRYVPMWGMAISFQNYVPFLGFWKSEWVGFAHFVKFFNHSDFEILFRNTFLLAVYNMVFFFPLPILLALLLNELRNEAYKRVIQTLVYVPHFVSWVVVVGIVYVFFSLDIGIVNQWLDMRGLAKWNLLMSAEWFRTLIVGEVIWKETGWGTIIFLAALSGINPQLYEAARMDGANRLRQIWHVTLPEIRSVIVILLILRLGNFLDTGFEQIFLHLNAMNREVGEVFDTYVYQVGILEGDFSYSTVVGLFKSIIGLLLVFVANWSARRLGEKGVF